MRDKARDLANAAGSFLSSGCDMKKTSPLLFIALKVLNRPFMLTDMDVVKIPGAFLRASFHRSIAMLVQTTRESTKEPLLLKDGLVIAAVCSTDSVRFA
jgi:hypothetical protein